MTSGHRAALGTLLAVLALLLAAGPAAAEDDPPAPPLGAPWFGPSLDWARDGAAGYADRLGARPSLYTQRVRYPLTAADGRYLRQFARQAATTGAVAVLDLQPRLPLGDLSPGAATELGRRLAQLHRDLDTYFLVRFASEMNGSWVPWGQQPVRYVAAFRTVAAAVHDATPHAAVVWSPAYGSGYPFGDAYGAVPPSGPSDPASLDTDGDGRLTDRDDPYGPYWPGDAAVDWVGLSVYYFGQAPVLGDNEVPPAGEYAARLAEVSGYGSGERVGRTAFYDRYAREDQPLLLETGALHNPGWSTPARRELVLKRTWWRQVLAQASEHPLVAGISWLEQVRPEAEAGGVVVDWRATVDPRSAAALRRDLAASDVTMDGVTDVAAPPGGTAGGQDGAAPTQPTDADRAGGSTSPDVGGAMRWVPPAIAVGGPAAVLALGLVGHARRRGWTSSDARSTTRRVRTR